MTSFASAEIPALGTCSLSSSIVDVLSRFCCVWAGGIHVHWFSITYCLLVLTFSLYVPLESVCLHSRGRSARLVARAPCCFVASQRVFLFCACQLFCRSSSFSSLTQRIHKNIWTWERLRFNSITISPICRRIQIFTGFPQFCFGWLHMGL